MMRPCSLTVSCLRHDVIVTSVPLNTYTGSDLPVCVNDALQCCTSDFIGYTMNGVTTNLTNTLNEEYNAAISRFAAKADKFFDCKCVRC